jgi:ribosomal protein L37AE/L43A
MRRRNIEQVKRIVDGKNKKSKSYYMGSTKSKDEKLAEVRKNKKEGDVWEENGAEVTLYNGIYMSTKSKYLQKVKEENKLPNNCPICGRVMNKHYDTKPWKLESKCRECAIEEEGKMRIAGTWKAYVEKRLRKNALAQIRDNKQMMEEKLNNLNKKIQLVGNETGELETWTLDQATCDMQRKTLEAQITQLNLLESKLIKEEKKSKKMDRKEK